MNVRLPKILLAVSGSASLLYFTALKIAERGSFTGFSLIWAVIGVLLWISVFFGGKIHRFAMRTVFANRGARIGIRVVTVLFISVSLVFFAYIRMPTPARAADSPAPGYLLVLGGGLRENGSLTGTLKARLDRALVYIAGHPGITVIVSGGQGKNTPWPEADEMARYLSGKNEAAGTEILLERTSGDTIQNLANCLGMIQTRGEPAPSVCILTSDFHLPRALILARRSGYTGVSGESAPVPALFTLNNWTREIGAYWKLAGRTVLEKLQFNTR